MSLPTDPTVIIEKDDSHIESKVEDESFHEMFQKYDENFIKNDSWISSPEETSVIKQELIANVHSIVNEFETKEGNEALKMDEEQIKQESFLVDETSDKSLIEERSVANIEITTNQDVIEDTKEPGLLNMFANIVVGVFEKYNDGNKKSHARSMNGDLTTNELRQDSDELIVEVQEFTNQNNTEESISLVIESIDKIVDPQIRNEFKADISGKTDLDMEEKIIIKTVQPDIEYQIQHFVPEIKENITKLTTQEKENLQAEIINQFLHKNESEVVIELPEISDSKQMPDVIEVLEHIVYLPEKDEIVHEDSFTTQSTIFDTIEMIPKDRHTRLRSMEKESDIATTTDLPPMANDKFVGFKETEDLVEAGSETTENDMFFEVKTDIKDDFETVVLALMMAKSLNLEEKTEENFTTELPIISIIEKIVEAKPKEVITVDEIEKIEINQIAPIEIKEDIGSFRSLTESKLVETPIEASPTVYETTETNEQTSDGSGYRYLEDRTEVWEVNTKVSISIVREFDNIEEILENIESRKSINVEFANENFINSTIDDETEEDLIAMERKVEDNTQQPDEEKATTTSKTVEINEKSSESNSSESSEEEKKEKKQNIKKLDNSSESDESNEKTVTKKITETNNSGLEVNSSEEENSTENLKDILTKKPSLDFLNLDGRKIVDTTDKLSTELPATGIKTEENQEIAVENFFQDLRSHDVRKKDHVNVVEFENDITLVTETKTQQSIETTAVPLEKFVVSLNLKPAPETEVVESTSESFDEYLTTVVQGIELTNDVKLTLQNFRSSMEKTASVPDTNTEIVSSKNTREPVGIDIQEIKSQGRIATDNTSKLWVIGSTSVFLVAIGGFLCVMYFKNFFQLNFNLLK